MGIEFKKTIFTSSQIIIKKKKQNIVIPLTKVDKLLYAKFSIKNYLSLGFGDCRTTGVLYVYLNEKINEKECIVFSLNMVILCKFQKTYLKRLSFITQERHGVIVNKKLNKNGKKKWLCKKYLW